VVVVGRTSRRMVFVAILVAVRNFEMHRAVSLRQHGFIVAVGDYKKGKERIGIRQFRVIFSYMGSGPPWTDFYENWQG